MDILTLFASPCMSLPKMRDAGGFVAYLRGIFQDYLARVSRLDSSDYVSSSVKAQHETIDALGEAIAESVRSYLAGLPAASFDTLAAAIQCIRPHLDRLCSLRDISPALQETAASLQSFLLDFCLAIGDDPRGNPASGERRRAETW